MSWERVATGVSWVSRIVYQRMPLALHRDELLMSTVLRLLAVKKGQRISNVL
jgi:hypothetical protein